MSRVGLCRASVPLAFDGHMTKLGDVGSIAGCPCCEARGYVTVTVPGCRGEGDIAEECPLCLGSMVLVYPLTPEFARALFVWEQGLGPDGVEGWDGSELAEVA